VGGLVRASKTLPPGFSGARARWAPDPTNMRVVAPSQPLPTLLSQALVAHTIELDNEAEHRLPHRTTRHRDPDTEPSGPWLVSFAVWANVLQYIDDDGTSVAELRARARTGELLLNGLTRWGYVAVTAPEGQPLRNPAQDGAVVHLRKAGRLGREVWPPLPALIDDRWRTRLGGTVVTRLEAALRTLFDELPVDPPASIPVIHPAQGGRTDPLLRRQQTARTVPPRGALSTLLSGVLLAFTADFEARARISLPISATSLRVLGRAGTRVGDLPRLTGVSREANAMCTAWLERHGCAVMEPDATARRGKVVRLTPKGDAAQRKYRRVLGATEESWRVRSGTGAVDELRAALEVVVGDGTYAASPLAPGLVPYPEGWRARVRRPDTLPHHPMVLHRGGYPDGS
jgi:DNA-binding MarR family transcriptional regulator